MELVKDVIIDTGLDCLKMLPFLIAAFLVLEALEHYSGTFTNRLLQKVGSAGPVVGAAAGCIPQCGFSVMAANLYAGGVISVGTLLSVFLATSDEAIIILLGNPRKGREILLLLIVKVIIAVIAGYLADLFLKKKPVHEKHLEDLCRDCGCHDHHGIVKPALFHTVKILLYLFLFSAVLNLLIEIIGMEQLSRLLLGHSIFQPILAALIGMIPNCASSVILTQLYLEQALSFPSVIAGLCAGAGVGLIVLFKMNEDKKENLKITVVLYVTAVIAGILLNILGF